MALAYNMKINQKKMKKLEKEYTIIKTKEQEEMVELRVSSIDLVRFFIIFQQHPPLSAQPLSKPIIKKYHFLVSIFK